MKKYKIYRVDNYILIYSEDGKHVWTGLAKNVRIIKNTEKPGEYKILHVTGWGCEVTLNIGQILKQDGTPYTISEWEAWYLRNTGIIMNPEDYDLSEFNNGSSDPFVRFTDLIPYLEDPTVVPNYSALPNPTTVAGKVYIVQNSQGTKWLWGSFGGTYYPEGFYYSDGTQWIYQKSAYQATQAEVNTGVVDDKFVTPLTLANSDYVLKSGWTIDYRNGKLTETFIIPYNLKINSITNLFNTPTTTININGTPYTLGSNISISDELEVTVDLISVITLNIERI